MGLVPALINIILTVTQFAWAQPQPQISFCLTKAHEFQSAEKKRNGEYVFDENDLKRGLPLGCRGHSYVATPRGEAGFRVVTEIDGEAWSIDEKSNFVRMARAGAKTQAYTPPGKNNPGGATAGGTKGQAATGGSTTSAQTPRGVGIFTAASNAGGGGAGGTGRDRVPMAVLAGDNITPLVQPAPLQVPALSSLLNPAVIRQRPEDEAKRKLDQCFSKRLFNTKACATLFGDLDSQCAKGKDKDQISVMCLEYTRRVTEVRLDDCDGSEETWGKCELRARQTAKYCENPLKQSSAECRALAKYLAKTPSGKPNPVVRSPAQAGENPGGLAGFNVDFTSIELLKNVQSLPPSLRKILTLRPVSYELKESRRKDVGFVAEEAEQVDPVLVSYSPDSSIQGVRYPQLTTLLTSGLQELYGMCKSDIDLNKELIRKVISLQDENAELKKKLEQHSRDLLLIKEKLGFK